MRRTAAPGIIIVFLVLTGLFHEVNGQEKRPCTSAKDCGPNAVCRRKICECELGYTGDGIMCMYVPRNEMINVAFKRPAFQSSTERGFGPELAVDSGRHGLVGQCSQTKRSNNPWWRVDLGVSVWVKGVLISSSKNDKDDNYKELSNVEIRIGDRKDSSDRVYNPLCRQGLQIPREPWPYHCSKPMLGRFVFIRLVREEAQLMLCEVEVFVNGDAKSSNWKYLIPYGNMMLRGTFKRLEKELVSLIVPTMGIRKGLKRDLIIDRPPQKGLLRVNFEVMMPLSYGYNKNKKLQAYCRPGKDTTSDYFIKATIISSHEDKYLVKAVYIPNIGVKRDPVEQEFHCNLEDLRIRANVCKLHSPCPQFSRCNTSFISPAFPPASYYCKCDPGYEPLEKRPGNLILPSEKCVKQKPTEPFIRHSRQNLALGMETSASSTDDYGKCKNKHCKESPAHSEFVVDGSFKSCFLSLTEYRPWLIVHLNRHHPIALINVVPGETDDRFNMKVFVGLHHKYTRCATVKTALPVWSVGCTTDSESYMWGDAVKIQTDASELSLCEVEVYAEAYDGNIALKHKTRDVKVNSIRQGSVTTDGIFYEGDCLSDNRKAHWDVRFGGIVRVAAVFVLHSKHSYSTAKGIVIRVVHDLSHWRSKDCINVIGYTGAAKYFKCKQYKEPLAGNSVRLEMRDQYEMLKLCEVEIYQTNTINVAANRPTIGTLNPKRGCDQKIDKPFKMNSNNFYWWSVDLLTKFEVHLIRIITYGARPEDFRGLKVFVDPDLKLFWSGKIPGDKKVATLEHPTNDRVQNISFAKPVEGRVVTLKSGESNELSFLEVEVYNGPLADVNECAIPNICPPNFECKNTGYSYSCECRGGFKYKIKEGGKEKNCVDRDECNVNGSCPLANSYCVNTFGSYRCLCKKGYKEVYDSKKHLMKCEDVDECKNAGLYNCPELTKCVNQKGGYTCECASGYESTMRGKTKGKDIKCKDIDECAKRTFSCHVNATCSNTIGSYKCTCFLGLKGDGSKHCSDLDSCLKGRKCKLEHQICKKIKGLYLCDCSEGFYHGFRKCEDNNECESDPKICGSNSVCINNEGSYKCSCQSGFKKTRADGKNCTDINECEEKNVCGDVARCENMMGMYDCICPKGYRYEEETKGCLDIDECAEHRCGPDTLCFNTNGSYSCACQAGFRSQNYTLECQDIDECLEMTFSCDPASNCENTPGGYDCKCKEGYYKTKQGTCAEKCSVSCGKNSFCYHGMCLCLPGYSLGPFNECYEESFFLLGSGMSLKSPVMLLAAGLLGCLALA